MKITFVWRQRSVRRGRCRVPDCTVAPITDSFPAEDSAGDTRQDRSDRRVLL